MYILGEAATSKISMAMQVYLKRTDIAKQQVCMLIFYFIIKGYMAKNDLQSHTYDMYISQSPCHSD